MFGTKSETRLVRRSRTAGTLAVVSESPEPQADLSSELSVLGSTVREPIAHPECFPAPEHCQSVTFTTEELSSMCPVTRQPDLSTLVIFYEPDELCIESKSLKLYLWGFRDRAVFAEALAAEIASEVMDTAKPHRVTVTLTQRPRGGIGLETLAVRTSAAS